MSSHEQQAQTLIEALPYIQKFTGKTIVVKYGGNAMISDELRRAVMSDVILLNLVGIRVVAVHGGGPEISAMLKMIGHESKFVDGLRYTDVTTMDIVQAVLCGKVNKDLVSQLAAWEAGPWACAAWTGSSSRRSRWTKNTAWWAGSPA